MINIKTKGLFYFGSYLFINLSTQKNNEEKGTVIEALPNTLFKVVLWNKQEVLAYLSGKMRMNRIKVMVGDTVTVLLDPYGGKGRITRRE